MRCPKCGYVSFDYLSACKKCQRDLTEVRQTLNLLDIRPEVPFLLGSLVGEYQEESAPAPGELAFTEQGEIELPGLDAGASETLEETMDMRSMQSTVDMEGMETTEEAAPAVEETHEVSLEELGDDLDLEEEEFLGLEIETDEEGQRPEQKADEEGLQTVPGVQETMEAIDLEELEVQETEAEVVPDKAAEPAEKVEDAEMELDLQEDELATLAKELEDQLQTEPEKKDSGLSEPSEEELAAAMQEMEKESESEKDKT
ncbi:MAG: hypothetical protein JRJ12_12055 [Deltaproteobacteria bacterium]|nr:hypothetical protein [Deltaproteobacteria bacterium]MBW2071976.1 hypothetical protein [Deltaproteobacteria bacterium]